MRFLIAPLGLSALVGIAAPAQAQQMPSATQRVFLLAQMAQEVGQAELLNNTLQQQLAQAQKQLADMKQKCGDPCKELAEPAK